MNWARILAYITGTVDQELLLRNEYLVAENRILKARLDGRLLLSEVERATLGEIGHRLGRKALEDVANAARPDTFLGWYRRLVARKFDGSRARRYPGRPRIDAAIEQLIVRMAKDNPGWGYDRIVGALANLGHEVSDQTVGNVLKRHGVLPAPARKKTTRWAQFIRSHLAVLAGTDFFSVELLTRRGLVTFYVLFFIHLASRKVEVAGMTAHPNELWMQQMARNVTMEGWGFLGTCRYLLHDWDAKLHRVVSSDHQGGWGRARCAAAAIAESECFRRALRALNKGGVPGSDDLLRTGIASARRQTLHDALQIRFIVPITLCC